MLSATGRGKAVYFFYFGAGAALMPVLTLYYEHVGLTGSQVGMLAALWPAGSVIGAATWGAIADATGRHKQIMIATIAGSVVAAQFFRLGTGFWALMPTALIFALIASPIMPLVDNAVMESLDSKRHRYGRIRLWGAIGWGISAPLVGLLIDRSTLQIVFPIYGGMMIVTLLAALLLPVRGIRGGVNVRTGFRAMAGDSRWIVFLVIVLVRGTGGAFTHHYLFIYMNAIGGGGLLRGLALATATVSELVAFALADRIVRRLGSRRLLLVSLVVTSVRLFLYSIIGIPELVLLPQLLHGVTFSLFLVAGVTYAQEIAAPGMGATAQSVFTSTNMGLGGIVGALLGGLLYQALGIRPMFLVASFITLAAGALFVWLLRRPQPRSKPAA